VKAVVVGRGLVLRGFWLADRDATERIRGELSKILSLLALQLAVRETGLPLLPILYQNPKLVLRTVY